MDRDKNKSALFSWLLVSSLTLPVGAQETEPAKVEKTKPAAQKADVEGLIERLGDPSYRARGEAEESLRELGKEALGPLEKAAESHADSEVQWRARRLVRQIESGEDAGLQPRRQGEQPAPRRGALDRRQPPDLGGVFDDLFERLERDFEVDVPRHRFFQDDFFRDLDEQMQEMRSRMRALDARGLPGFDQFGTGTGQSFQMQVGPEGVSVEVSERDENGEMQTKSYEAPDLETFRTQYPEVAERYLDRSDTPGLTLRFGRDLPGFGGRSLLRTMPGLPPRGLGDDGPRLGVFVAELDAAALEELGIEGTKGLRVQSVVPASLAAELGVEADDIVLEISGEPVGSVEDVRAALHKAGDRVAVKVHRGDQTLSLERTAGADPSGELKPRKARRQAR